MLAFLLTRFWQFLLTLLGITLLTFAIMHLSPGEPTALGGELNPRITAQARDRLRQLYGLDRPLHVQYLSWLRRCLTLDFGRSFKDGQQVTSKIARRLPITITISVLALMIVLAVSLTLGIRAAVAHDTFTDRSINLFVLVGYSIPTFWLALLLMILFGVKLGWLPISGYQSPDASTLAFGARLLDWGAHLILPVFVAAFTSLAFMTGLTRLEMLEVIRQDYIRTARAKGLSERTVVYKHAFRNVLSPILTVLGLSVPGLIGGGVIFETIFAIPGMGQLFYQSVLARDYPVIMGITVLGAVFTLFGNLLADIAYAVSDPRVRYDQRTGA